MTNTMISRGLLALGFFSFGCSGDDGTSVTITPASGACAVLNAGEFCEIEIMGDVEITATEPIMVGHYLKSVIEGAGGSGDPALAISVPIEQYRNSYVFLVPMQYDMQYISVVTPAGGTVRLDNTDVTGMLAPFGDGNFIAGRIPVQAGQHELLCGDSCGLEVYGYSDAVSYLFAGGLDLEQIVID